MSTGLPHPAAYDTSTSPFVVDEVTGLTWWRSVGITGTLAHDEAYCASQGFRLPSLIELMTIVDPTRMYPTADTAAFGNLVSPFETSDMDWFRTSSWAAGWSDLYGSLEANQAMWYVNLGTGTVEYWGVDGQGAGAMDNILCVKGAMGNGSGPSCQYQVEDGGTATGTVLDTNTGLTWQQAVTSTNYTLSAATAYCANNTAGLPGSGWRLPSYDELMSIVDVASAHPAVDASVFPNVPLSSDTSPFFTSSSSPGSPYGGDTGPWVVDFGLGDGFVVATTSNPKAHVRCVR